MKNDTLWVSPNTGIGASANTISDFIEPTLVLDSANYIPKLKGSSYKKLFVYRLVLVEDPLFAKITDPFVVGMSGLNSRYEYKFEEGQLAALMEEYFFFKEESCTS
jgi:hypothetical protein